MSDEYILVIETEDPNMLTIESSYVDDIGVLEIEIENTPSVNILTGVGTITLSDIPDIPVSKIIGLDDYLDGYIDTIDVDGGSP